MHRAEDLNFERNTMGCPKQCTCWEKTILYGGEYFFSGGEIVVRIETKEFYCGALFETVHCLGHPIVLQRFSVSNLARTFFRSVHEGGKLIIVCIPE
jgi:hypothetical protein